MRRSTSTRPRAIIAEHLLGDIEQVPPMVSALKVGGRRLHELAREGIEIERAPRPVRVDRFDIVGEPSTTTAARCCTSRSTVAPGTYVRSLAADLGRAARHPAPTCATCAAPRSSRSRSTRPRRPTSASCCRRSRRCGRCPQVTVDDDDARRDRRRQATAVASRRRAVGDGHRPPASCSPCTRRSATARAKPAVVLRRRADSVRPRAR